MHSDGLAELTRRSMLSGLTGVLALGAGCVGDGYSDIRAKVIEYQGRMDVSLSLAPTGTVRTGAAEIRVTGLEGVRELNVIHDGELFVLGGHIPQQHELAVGETTTRVYAPFGTSTLALADQSGELLANATIETTGKMLGKEITKHEE